MTFIALENDRCQALDIGWKDTKRVCLSQRILDCISSKFFHCAQEPFLQFSIEYLASVHRDERTNMGIDLAHDESVHIEELCEALHGQV